MTNERAIMAVDLNRVFMAVAIMADLSNRLFMARPHFQLLTLIVINAKQIDKGQRIRWNPFILRY